MFDILPNCFTTFGAFGKFCLLLKKQIKTKQNKTLHNTTRNSLFYIILFHYYPITTLLFSSLLSVATHSLELRRITAFTSLLHPSRCSVAVPISIFCIPTTLFTTQECVYTCTCRAKQETSSSGKRRQLLPRNWM